MEKEKEKTIHSWVLAKYETGKETDVVMREATWYDFVNGSDFTQSETANLYEITTLQHFLPRTWSKVQRFTVPMPDQPNGSGSCGVGVIYCVRDLSHGIQEKFTWTYKESPKLRAQLMIELLRS